MKHFMTTRTRDEQGRKLQSGPSPESDAASMRKLISKAMLRWESMNAAGRLQGRGLLRDEILARVAQEVGTSVHMVRSVLSAVKA